MKKNQPALASIPSDYTYSTKPIEPATSDLEDDPIPIIDFSLLASGNPDQQSKFIQDLGKACEEWGGFMLINHGVPENLMKAMIEACNDFFNLTEEEKREFAGKHVFDPIRCGTSLSGRVDKILLWRDFLKIIVHPEFNFPYKLTGFSELALEFCKRIRILMKLEAYKCSTMASGINVNALHNDFFINIADQLEILSNGKYKSLVHRAVVNNKATRISIAIPNGPSLDTIVGPAVELVNSETHPAAYIPMKFKEYLEFLESRKIGGKFPLDHLKVQIV
ncbi:hypothetical protein F0562_028899 [Nyssa sinensis]|uniref:Fe2OG dioxygenase domain-containing protein n=1 Tax=Nyssa sinensis TaxID=561372 RepID=A0A5J5B5K0_9ASTE|nr:hypothetical protein F0562_028899 [Nyssa sinensis]